MHEHPKNGMGDTPDGQSETDQNLNGNGQRTEANGSGWRETGEEFDSLRSSFRSSYQEGAAEGPSWEEVAQAFRTLGGALTHMVAGAGNTLRDPAVKQQVQKTTRTAVEATAALVTEWVAEVRSRLEDQCEEQQGSGGRHGSAEKSTDSGDEENPSSDQSSQSP